jgi:MFS family permease
MNASAESRRAAYPWLVVGLLWPVALLNYLDRQLVSTMKRSIMADLPSIATEENFGRVMAIFMWVYAFVSPAGGYLADRFNRRWMVIGSLGVWSLVTWLTGHVHSFEQMWWVRAAMGVSEACYIPAALALIADFHPGTTRSRAVGIHQTGIYAGQALGGIGGVIADSAFGWRSAFSWFGLAGVSYAALLLFTLPAAPPPVEGGEKKNVSIGAALAGLLGVGSFILLVLYFTLPAMPGWVVKNWMPSVLADTFHLAQGKAGFSATLYVTIASLVGALVGGAVADRWMRVTSRGRILASAVGMGLCIPALFGVGYAPTLTVAIAFLVLFGVGWGFFDANNMPILCQIVRPEYRATGYGLMNMVSISGGAWVTVKMGAMRDHGAAPSVIFSLCAIAAAVSVVLVLLIRPKPAESLS